jgi:hypothetical protein
LEGVAFGWFERCYGLPLDMQIAESVALSRLRPLSFCAPMNRLLGDGQ